MDIKSVGLPNAAQPKKTVKVNVPKKALEKMPDETKGVIFEKSEKTDKPSGDYSKIAKDKGKLGEKDKTQLSEIDKLKIQMDEKMNGAFYLMVKDALDGQNVGMKAAIEKILQERGEEITPEMIEEAQADVAEGGFYSVEATTERIMKFAKTISGDDPAKAGLLKDAFEKGFEEAEKIWGDELPQISKDTYDSVMKAFDEWENEGLNDNEGDTSPPVESETVVTSDTASQADA